MLWDSVLCDASRDDALPFWSREVTDKANLFLSSAAPSSSLVDVGLLGNVVPSPASESNRPEQTEPARKKAKTGGGRQTTTQEGRQKNRSGKEICEKYNSAEGCSLPCPSGQMHQCKICLKMGHSALNC
eukprot:3348924-Amphidinium_carterae.1